MVLRQHEGPPARFQRLAVAFQNGIHAGLVVAAHLGQQGAGRQADQVVGVGKPPRLVEIVDPPDQPALDVAPRSEILHVQVAHRQRLGPARRVAADVFPDLRPAVIRGAHKREARRAHLRVLELQVRIDNPQVPRQPRFIFRRRLFYVHASPAVAGVSIHLSTPRGCGPARSQSTRTSAAFFMSTESAGLSSKNAAIELISGS